MRRSLANIYTFAEGLEEVAGLGISKNSEGKISVAKAHFVTLTVQHGRNGTYPDMMKTVNMLRDCWSSVRKRVNRAGWKYLRVMEPGEQNGYPHYHMIVVGASDEGIEEFVKAWVSAANRLGNPARMVAQEYGLVEDIHNVGAYVSKYVSKSFKPGADEDHADNENWWRWMELCYREGIRTYAMDAQSRAFVARKYPDKLLSGVGEIDFGQYLDPDVGVHEIEDTEIQQNEVKSEIPVHCGQTGVAGSPPSDTAYLIDEAGSVRRGERGEGSPSPKMCTGRAINSVAVTKYVNCKEDSNLFEFVLRVATNQKSPFRNGMALLG
jgi:Bacteriophage replication gene A protein (GPA).